MTQPWKLGSLAALVGAGVLAAAAFTAGSADAGAATSQMTEGDGSVAISPASSLHPSRTSALLEHPSRTSALLDHPSRTSALLDHPSRTPGLVR